MWQQGKLSLGRLTNANITMSTSFQSGDKKSKEKSSSNRTCLNQQNMDAQQEAQARQLQMVRNNPGEYVDFDIPWRLDLSYSLTYTKTIIPDSGRGSDQSEPIRELQRRFQPYAQVENRPEQWLRFREPGDRLYEYVHLPRSALILIYPSTLIPLGTYRQFSITISAKSGLLGDLRINRTRQFYDFTTKTVLFFNVVHIILNIFSFGAGMSSLLSPWVDTGGRK